MLPLMHPVHLKLWVALAMLLGASLQSGAAAQDSPDPGEELAARFSFERGARELDRRAARWAKSRECVTCHTNGMALVAQPLVSKNRAAIRETRRFAEGYLLGHLTGELESSGQQGSVTGLVATTAFLAMSDARRGKGPTQAVRAGLDHAWSTLDESGTWEEWLQCNWPPFEADTVFAPTLMLVALGELGDVHGKEALRPADREGAAALVAGLKTREPLGLHDRAMRLWASRSFGDLISEEQRTAWREELLLAQGEDGGWPMASLAASSWRHDSGEPFSAESGAYATAFSLYVLLRSGVERDDGRIERGLEWLRRNQRESGLWFDRSPRRDRHHYISHAASAFALLALDTP